MHPAVLLRDGLAKDALDSVLNCFSPPMTTSRPATLQCSTGAKDHTPRFPEYRLPTDAGPGAYIASEFNGRGPAYSIARTSTKSPGAPDSPGPGQYVEVHLSARQDKDASEGFGKRDSPRFATGETSIVFGVRWSHHDSRATKTTVRAYIISLAGMFTHEEPHQG